MQSNFWWEMKIPLETARGIRRAECNYLNWNPADISDNEDQGIFKNQMLYFRSVPLALAFSAVCLLLPQVDRTPNTEYPASLNSSANSFCKHREAKFMLTE